MVNIAPGRMFSTCGIVEFVAEKAVLPIEKKMDQCTGHRKNPHPTAEGGAGWALLNFGWLSDYCTFFTTAGGGAEPTSTSDADMM